MAQSGGGLPAWHSHRRRRAGHGCRALAVDGKTLRGSGRPGAHVHLFAVMDHATSAVLGQVDVADKTNEITRFVPLLDGLDLTATVITADAMHTQREHADYLAATSRRRTCWWSSATSPASTTSSRPCPGATSA
jgi:hypothetical protein